jgi:peptide/nickel transport system substrate-binding protein
MKKLLNLVMVLSMLLVMLPMVANAAPLAQEEGESYVVQAGDTLSKLADKYLGNPLAYQAIVIATNEKAMTDPSYSIIWNPEAVEPGWKIFIPSKDKAEEYMAKPPVALPIPKTFNEAPMLKEMVDKGELPPVEERLSEEPLVVPPIEMVGQYGGTWRRGFMGIKDFHAFGRQVYEPMLRWARNPADPIQPGIAKRWEWSEDGKTLTLFIRKGIKWSDGEPFTVDDIIFWWEDIELDTNITAAPHTEWVVNGKPMTLEKVDDTTIKLHFDGPNGLAIRMLAFHGNQWPLGFERFGFFAPAHYLKQFHPKHNPEVTDYTLFEEKSFDFDTERPVLTAWKITEWGPGATVMVAKRNPYYWKVDPEGNQLPYIDEIRFDLFENAEGINIKAAAGEIDFQFRRIDIAKLPVFKENAAKGDYRVVLWPDAVPSHIGFAINQSIADPKLREVFQNVKFRQALAVAIDRNHVNETVYLGLGKMRNFTVLPASPYYQPELEMMNAEYDVDKANALLDEIGLKKGADGFRTLPDGSPLEVTIETSLQAGDPLAVIELVADYWNKVGVKTAVKTMTRDVFWPKAGANEIQVAPWTTDRGLEPMVDPIYMFPFDDRSWIAPAFGTWYKTGGAMGEEPTAEFKASMDLYDKFKATVDADEQVKLGKEIVKRESDNVWYIGVVGMTPSVVIAKNNFRNFPGDGKYTTDWIYMSPGNLDPCQFFFEK